MNGVNVLYQEPIFKTIYANETIISILVSLFLFMIFGALISGLCLSLKGTIIFSVLGVISIFSSFVLKSYSTYTKELDHYEYKVTIDDSVPMKEFLSKYEIINQEGEIFTIVERENINEEGKWYSK